MTVRELIEELEEFPMDLPVVSNMKEISFVDYEDKVYYLDKMEDNYFYTEAIVLR